MNSRKLMGLVIQSVVLILMATVLVKNVSSVYQNKVFAKTSYSIYQITSGVKRCMCNGVQSTNHEAKIDERSTKEKANDVLCTEVNDQLLS
nr:hypothetical protein [Tanacetum cinerariifolium]